MPISREVLDRVKAIAIHEGHPLVAKNFKFQWNTDGDEVINEGSETKDNVPTIDYELPPTPLLLEVEQHEDEQIYDEANTQNDHEILENNDNNDRIDDNNINEDDSNDEDEHIELNNEEPLVNQEEEVVLQDNENITAEEETIENATINANEN